MRGSKSSAASPRSNLGGPATLAAVVALLAAIGSAAAWWCFTHGYTLYYGDAEAHLNIARRILDSRTPGPDQIGTVWLPLPHFLLIPFVMRDAWWHNGLAGVVPSVICFVIAGAFLFSAARRIYVECRRRTGRHSAVRAQSEHPVPASDAHDRAAVPGFARGAAVGHAVVPRFAIAVGSADRRGCVECRFAHALRRLVPDPVRLLVPVG